MQTTPVNLLLFYSKFKLISPPPLGFLMPRGITGVIGSRCKHTNGEAIFNFKCGGGVRRKDLLCVNIDPFFYMGKWRALGLISRQSILSLSSEAASVRDCTVIIHVVLHWEGPGGVISSRFFGIIIDQTAFYRFLRFRFWGEGSIF